MWNSKKAMGYCSAASSPQPDLVGANNSDCNTTREEHTIQRFPKQHNSQKWEPDVRQPKLTNRPGFQGPISVTNTRILRAPQPVADRRLEQRKVMLVKLAFCSLSRNARVSKNPMTNGELREGVLNPTRQETHEPEMNPLSTPLLLGEKFSTYAPSQ